MSLGPGTSELTPSIVDPPRMPLRIETVRRQFDRRAAHFDEQAFAVREVGRRLIERLQVIRLEPRLIADVGCGAGGARRALQARYPRAQWLGVDISPKMLALASTPATTLQRLVRWRPWRSAVIRAEAAALPLAGDSVDLVFSNLMLNWHPVPHSVFPEWLRVLRVDGLLLFSCWGPDTFKELRAAYAQAGIAARPMSFVDMHDLGDMMVAAGFAAPVVDAEIIKLMFSSSAVLLREASALGGNARDDRGRGLVSGAKSRALVDALEKMRDGQGRITVTFEVAYGHAWKPPPRRGGNASISLEQVRAELRRR